MGAMLPAESEPSDPVESEESSSSESDRLCLSLDFLALARLSSISLSRSLASVVRLLLSSSRDLRSDARPAKPSDWSASVSSVLSLPFPFAPAAAAVRRLPAASNLAPSARAYPLAFAACRVSLLLVAYICFSLFILSVIARFFSSFRAIPYLYPASASLPSCLIRFSSALMVRAGILKYWTPARVRCMRQTLACHMQSVVNAWISAMR